MIHSKEYKVTQLIAHLVCGFAALCAILPFALLIIASFTDGDWATEYGFSFFPQEWSLDAYKYIVAEWKTIGSAYAMTIKLTVVGTVCHLVLSTLFAYGISQKHIPGMKLFSFLLIFTMLFNGGLVSTYYTYVKLLEIKNTFAAILVPGLMMNAFSVILIKNYFTHSIPSTLLEAARIDGAGEFTIFMRIVMPLSKPILATVGMMAALAYWNDWQNGMYYLSARKGSQYYTIQTVLNNINNDIMALLQSQQSGQLIQGAVSDLPTTTIRMAIAVIGILPIVIAYPFFQRYFVKGITLGGIKE